MHDSYKTLFEAIRAKCQRDGWFGPDALKPEENQPLSDDPFYDEYDDKAIVADDPARTGFLFPTASEEQVRATEERLGFPLPALLRQLYTQMANGGFGPGTGLPGVKDGFTGVYPHDDGSLWAYSEYYQDEKEAFFSYATYLEQAARSRARGQRAWMQVPQGERLEHILPLDDLGCCQYINVDDRGRLFLIAPTENDAFYGLSELPWNLEEWLWRWVRGEDLLEIHHRGAA